MLKLFRNFLTFITLFNLSFSQWPTDPNEPGVDITFGNVTIVTFQRVSDGFGGFWAMITYNFDSNNRFIQHVDSLGYKTISDSTTVFGAGPITPQEKNILNSGDGSIFNFYGVVDSVIDCDATPCIVEELYLQKITKTGNKPWGENGIIVGPAEEDWINYDGTPGWINDSEIVTTSDGGVYVIRPANNAHQIRAYKYSPEGVTLWEGGINLFDSTWATVKSIVSDYEDGFIVDLDSKYHRISPEGEFLWGEDGIRKSEYEFIWNKLQSNQLNGTIVRRRSANLVYVNRLNNDGELLWGDAGILLTENSNPDFGFSIELKSDGGLIFGYNDHYINQLSNEGEILWENDIYFESNIKGFIPGDSSSIIVSLYSVTDSVYSQNKISASGELVWDEFNYQFPGKVITDSHDGLILVHATDSRLINKYGELGVPILETAEVENEMFPEILNLESIYPNPFNPAVSIVFSSIRPSPVEITIYNILGKKVFYESISNLETGKMRITWNGSDSNGATVPSGIYLLKIVQENYIVTNKIVKLK